MSEVPTITVTPHGRSNGGDDLLPGGFSSHIAADIEIPIASEVLAFADRHGITSPVKLAIASVRQSFPTLRDLQVRLDNDPEEDGEWIVIDVTAAEEPERFLQAYDRCADIWVRQLPAAALGMIRLSYSLV